ncbi:MAG TPA: response regulator [bacterium]|nr:response regulator [bacterium]
MENPTILLVDDDEGHLLVARRAFERSKLPVQVRVARDGDEALSLLGLGGSEASPEAVDPKMISFVAVMLDLRMPGLSGWDLLRRIRASDRTKQLPVIIVSSSERPNDVRLSYELGANSYLMKRFDPEKPGAYLVDAAHYWTELNEPPRPSSMSPRKIA